MAENSLVTAVLTSLLTLTGTYALQSRQEARDEANDFLDAAQNKQPGDTTSRSSRPISNTPYEA